MGFNKRYLPELSILKRQYEEMDRQQFIRTYTRVDALVGSSESFAFLQQVLQKEVHPVTSSDPGKK